LKRTGNSVFVLVSFRFAYILLTLISVQYATIMKVIVMGRKDNLPVNSVTGSNKKDIGLFEEIQHHIYTLRGVQVMLDKDLAQLYNVEVKRLNEQLKRNKSRFPDEFCFQLTSEEFASLRSQIVTIENLNLKSQIVTSSGQRNLKSQIATASWGGRRTNPYAFTEQGIAMLSSVLRSETAIKLALK